jgi:uncharacterized membrane protein
MTYEPGVPPAAAPEKDRGTLALVLGIISLFIFGLVLGLPAIYFGFKSHQTRGKIGAVLGILGVLGWAWLLFVRR